MRRSTPALIASFAVFIGGCGTLKRSATIIAHQPCCVSETRPIPYPATYSLYAVTPTGAEAGPIDTVVVEEGKRIGFVHTPDGSLVAYAAGRRALIPEGSYVWRVEPNSRRPYSGVFEIDDPEATSGKIISAAAKGAIGVLSLIPLAIKALAGGGGVGR